MKEHVVTIEEWLHLTELSLPVVKNDNDEGSIYKVFKVGFVLVSLEDCAKHSIKPQRKMDGRCLLPTAVIEAEGKRQLCRLPLALTSWAYDSVALAHAGMNSFPSDVEFGVLKGRTYAEIL